MNMIMKNPIRAAARLALLLGTATATVAQLGVTAPAGGSQSASSTLTTASATGTIQACAYEARNQLLFDMESRLKIVETPLDELARKAQVLPEPVRDKFGAALGELKTQKAALKMGMEVAGKATAKNWPQVRAALAFSYVDYIGAVTHLESIVADNLGG